MNIKIQELREYLSEHPVIRERSEVEPLMEVIYKFYIETNGPDDGKLKECFENIWQYTDSLPFSNRDAISCTVVELAAEQERKAFLDGLQAGAQFVLELTADP